MDVAIPTTPPITISAETDLFQFHGILGSGGISGIGGMGGGMSGGMNGSVIGSGSGVSSPANFANFFADGLSRSWDIDAGLEFF